MLLASKTLSKMRAQGIRGLNRRIAEHGAILHSIHDRVQNMDDRTRLTQAANDERIQSMCARFDGMNRSVVHTRRLGQQVMDYLNTFPRKIQGLLRVILQSNIQTYNLMLQIHQNISPRPSQLLESDIKFEDALGEIKQLPYEYFRYWEVRISSSYDRKSIINLKGKAFRRLPPRAFQIQAR